MKEPTSNESKRRSHLRRLDRVYLREPVYFITTCTAGRRSKLANPLFHSICREVWQKGREIQKWSVGRYVIMPDHVHFFCRPLSDVRSDLSGFVGAWKQWTSKTAALKVGWEPPLWQAEFFDHLIRSGESLDDKWEYVCRNPERAGLVDQWEDWPYQGNLDVWERY